MQAIQLDRTESRVYEISTSGNETQENRTPENKICADAEAAKLWAALKDPNGNPGELSVYQQDGVTYSYRRDDHNNMEERKRWQITWPDGSVTDCKSTLLAAQLGTNGHFEGARNAWAWVVDPLVVVDENSNADSGALGGALNQAAANIRLYQFTPEDRAKLNDLHAALKGKK